MDTNPQIIKVSSKRQITIPAKLYHALGFGEHAWCAVLGDGIYLCPAQDGQPDFDEAALARAVAGMPACAAETAPASVQTAAKGEGVWSVFGGKATDSAAGGESTAATPAPAARREGAPAEGPAASAGSGDGAAREAEEAKPPAVRRPRAVRTANSRPLLGLASEPAIRDDETVRSVAETVRRAAGDYPAIKKVFLFGAFARGDYDDASAIDLRLELGAFGSFGLHDLMVFSRMVEQATGRRANVVSAEVVVNQELAAAIERDKVLIFEQ